jgi:hypothetical protein
MFSSSTVSSASLAFPSFLFLPHKQRDINIIVATCTCKIASYFCLIALMEPEFFLRTERWAQRHPDANIHPPKYFSNAPIKLGEKCDVTVLI